MIGLLPVTAIVAAILLTPKGRISLLAIALALPLFVPNANEALPLGSANLFPQDLMIGVALGAWACGALLNRQDGASTAVPRSAVLGWPFALLAGSIIVATLRGHYSYGSSLLGQPLRLVLYAGIVVVLAGMTVERLYRFLLWLFYVGLSVTMVWAAYYIATGTSQSASENLSTGGSRVLAVSTSIYCAGAMFLALLSLQLEKRIPHRLLHMTMAAFGFAGVVLGFGRAVFLAVFLGGFILLVTSRALRHSLGSLLPLAAPFIVLIAILLPRVAPDLITSFEHRVASPPVQDANVQWRVKANEAVLAQVRESPYFGVGFGRQSEFYLDVENSIGYLVPFRQEIGQDPHNGYLFLLAGGGIVTLGSFLLVLAVYTIDWIRRFRRNDHGLERLLLAWAALTLFTALLNAGSGTSFESTSDVLLIWTLLVLPAVVPLRGQADRPERLPRARMRPSSFSPTAREA